MYNYVTLSIYIYIYYLFTYRHTCILYLERALRAAATVLVPQVLIRLLPEESEALGPPKKTRRLFGSSRFIGASGTLGFRTWDFRV